MNRRKRALMLLSAFPMFFVYFCTKWAIMLLAIMVLIHGEKSASTFTHVVIYTITLVSTGYWFYYFSLKQWGTLFVVKKRVEALTNTH